MFRPPNQLLLTRRSTPDIVLLTGRTNSAPHTRVSLQCHTEWVNTGHHAHMNRVVLVHLITVMDECADKRTADFMKEYK